MSDYSAFQIVVIGGYCLVGGIAAWRDRCDAEARAVRERVLEAARRDANLLHKELAGELDIHAAHWARDLVNGGNLTAHLLIAARRPEYGAALVLRILAFLGYTREPETQRQERLREAMALVRVPRKAGLDCQESDSSAA